MPNNKLVNILMWIYLGSCNIRSQLKESYMVKEIYYCTFKGLWKEAAPKKVTLVAQ